MDGINKKCLKCNKKCKQFAQIQVIYCPNFKKEVLPDAKLEEVQLPHREN
jgi:hypothetical protein